jgi:hypothetical protein
MARTAVPALQLAADAGVNVAAGAAGSVTMDQPNGHNVTGIKRFSRVVLELNASAGTTATIKAGAFPPAETGDGDLVVTFSTTLPTIIGPLTSARFAQPDGSINVDLAAAAAGTIRVFELARA